MTNGRRVPTGREGGKSVCDPGRGLLGKGDIDLDFRADEVIVNRRERQF